MLHYQNTRTEQIVNRLVALGNSFKLIISVTWTILFGVGFSIAGALVSPDYWWIIGLIGLFIGFILGLLLATATTVVVEWMAQLLIAQGEILAELRK
jgi:hypothetical protein